MAKFRQSNQSLFDGGYNFMLELCFSMRYNLLVSDEFIDLHTIYKGEQFRLLFRLSSEIACGFDLRKFIQPSKSFKVDVTT